MCAHVCVCAHLYVQKTDLDEVQRIMKKGNEKGRMKAGKISECERCSKRLGGKIK